ncbi:MAG: HPr family phosphocarrier protein [Lachnospiraceae bacterium]|nr:HPr family phosphocarrier protein [Lachnospiraceae bacterium]
MKTFTYTIQDEIGIHARPAGLLVKAAKGYESEITLTCKGKKASAAKLMAVMGMGVKCGDEVTVTVEGADETAAAKGMEEFFNSNL